MKKLVYIVVLVISISIINNLIHSIYNLSQKKNVVAKTQEELKKERDQHARLMDQLQMVKRQDFVEEEARNKLFLVQPGETVVVLPTPVDDGQDTSQTKEKKLPIWQQWVVLFYGAS